MILNSPTISGSLTVTGNIITSGSITLSGSVASASYADTASFVALAQSASNAVSAQTASFANTFTVASTLTAQTLVVQTITSSVDFVTGSTRFGSIAANTHVFTGSVNITGSVAISSSATYALDVAGTGRLTGTIKYSGTSQILDASSGTTGYLYQYLANTTGSAYFGLERSTGGGLFTNSSAYATVLGSTTATSLQFATNGIIRATITSGGDIGINTTTITNPNGVDKLLEIKSAGSVGVVLNDSRDANPMCLENRGAVFHLAYGTTNLIVADGTTKNVGIANNGYSNYRLNVRGAGLTSATYSFRAEDSGTNTLLQIRNDGIIDTGLQAGSPYNNTTANAVNMRVDGGGILLRSTASSQRFKEEIKDWNASGLDTILALKPKTFKYKKDYYDKADVDFLGLIAEDVAEVSPYLADYENEDRTGEVENVRYANIVVPLIKAIQELKTQNDALQSRIETLESK
jgi:hypothetical protein